MSSKSRRPAGSTRIPYTRAELHDHAVRGHTGQALSMISFPLGGIGTGTIGLGGRGELRDWEIFNNPNLGYRPPYTMPYVFCRQGRETVAKVLERQLLPPYHDTHGLPPEQLTGLPRLAEALFVGTYPVARIVFQDDALPVWVTLEAFNPMIPFDAEDSAIPAAVLLYRLTNRTRRATSGSLALSMANTVGLAAGKDGLGRNVNAFRSARDFRGLYITSAKHAPGDLGYGTEALVTTAPGVTCATDFDEPGHRFDKAQKVWDDYRADGRLDGPRAKTPPSADGETRIGMLSAEYRLRPAQSTEIAFVITWSFPNRLANWHLPAGAAPPVVRNHYARRFPDAWKAARYVVSNLARLRTETLRFERALFDSTLPGAVLDAVSSQMSTIRTNTTMWLDYPPAEKHGQIFAFEGCNATTGCCPMNCTHVWNYEQSMAHLYPALERTMRRTDYQENLHDGGAMYFRTALPLRSRRPRWGRRVPAADGQFGTVVKVYREWRISGDTRWLKEIWPRVRESIEFAWKGFARWDADADGVMEGVQHNTYDIEFHGPNTMCGSLYLAALLAGAEMAEAVGDAEAAATFRRVFASGRRRHDRMLFNGEFYVQRVAGSAKPYRGVFGQAIGRGRPKYQYGRGCLADHLLGQWAAHVAGLGYVLPEDHVRSGVAAVFRHNFMPDLFRHESVQRTYALGDEAGLVLCTWPDGKRERFPFIYSDEVWTGVEYQVAAHLIYEGLIDEGLALVKAARDRHDGIRRNPWNEFECGDHYARAMSSWSLLLALSGQRYDGRTRTLTVKPALKADDFACLFTAAEGYGMVARRRRRSAVTVVVECLGGRVKLAAVEFDRPVGWTAGRATAACTLNGRTVTGEPRAAEDGLGIRFPHPLTLRAGDRLGARVRPRARG